MNNEEEIIWEGKSSPWASLKYFIFHFILFSLGIILFKILPWKILSIPALLLPIRSTWKALYEVLYISTATYELTDHRIIRKEGVFNRITYEVELYRVTNIILLEPLALRLFSLGTIHISSFQEGVGDLFIIGIKDAEEIKEEIRELVMQRKSEYSLVEYH